MIATDISAELCIKYIDRFLMFYIATADRLQRTAAWMEKLEGGGCCGVAVIWFIGRFVFVWLGLLLVWVVNLFGSVQCCLVWFGLFG